MKDKLEKIIAYDSENQVLDYKAEEYKLGKDFKKHEILKDVSAMANNPSQEDKLIIIGVKEKNGHANEFVEFEPMFDEANYQQYISENIEPGINFEYVPFDYKGHSLMVFRIFNNNQRPYLLKRDIKNAKDYKIIEYREGDGFIRKGTRNSKIKREDLELIYKNRYTLKDRKSDIIVTPSVFPSQDELLLKYKLDCFDIHIENRSKQSIELDGIELNITKTEGLKLLSVLKARKILKNHFEENYTQVGPSGFRMPVIDTDIDLTYITITESEAQFTIIKDKSRMQNNVLTIAQESSEKSVFGNDIILLFSEKTKLHGVIILKSDDFITGAFRQPFTIEL